MAPAKDQTLLLSLVVRHAAGRPPAVNHSTIVRGLEGYTMVAFAHESASSGGKKCEAPEGP